VNYYPFHIGDYRSATMHLSNDEDLAYRRLLDFYYDTEAPIPLDTQQVSRRLRVGSEHIEAVLKDFFRHTPEGWVHDRCDIEIAEYRVRADRSRTNGQKGGRRKSAPANENNPAGTQQEPASNPAATQGLANQEPRTKNQEPEKEEGKRKRSPSFDAAAIELPDWLDREAWASWCADRKKRGKAITETAARLQVKQLGEYLEAGHIPERVIEHSIASGYTGLFAPKGITPSAAPGKAPESFRERDERIARERFNALVYGSSSGAKTPDAFDDFDNVIDMTPTQQRIAP